MSELFMFFSVSAALLLLYLLQTRVLDATKKPAWGPISRLILAIILGVVAMPQIITAGTAYAQLEVVDARDSKPTLWLLLTGFFVLIILVLAAYFMQPKLKIGRPGDQTVDITSLTKHERESVVEDVWTAQTHVSKTGLIIYAFAVLTVTAGLVLALIGDAPWAASIVMLATLLLILFAGAIGLIFKVRVDQTGLEAKSILGWPVFCVPINEIQTASVAQISPFSEFGGWGIRWIPGGFGIIMRAGEALVLTRKNGKTFTVTVDNAAAAAQILTIAATRSS